jgi:monofunctional biosynthetic peptidoglycan transglycosylase
MARSRKSFVHRLLRALLVCALGFLMVTVGLAFLFRFVPPPMTGLMTERYIEAQLSHWQKQRIYYHRLYYWKPLKKIAPVMGLAVMTAEDQNFQEHFGFDWEAIAKAIAHNQKSRHIKGASTISQQTAKNLFLWSDRSWLRKGLEVYFTLLIEVTWPKERILEMYLNIIEFGSGVYGVEAASRFYFQKSASELNTSEAALLAAVLPNPHVYKADNPSDYVRERQQWILGHMKYVK